MLILFQIYGDGEQTRSFQYVSDLVEGLIALMNGNYTQPVNLGNPEEYTIRQFAEIIKKLVGQSLVHISSSPLKKQSMFYTRKRCYHLKKLTGEYYLEKCSKDVTRIVLLIFRLLLGSCQFLWTLMLEKLSISVNLNTSRNKVYIEIIFCLL